MPQMPIFEDVKDFALLLFTKSLDWEYEKGFRILKSGHSDKTISFSSDIVENIILGMKMQINHKKNVDIIKRDFPSTKIFEARKKKFEFRLDTIPIIK